MSGVSALTQLRGSDRCLHTCLNVSILDWEKLEKHSWSLSQFVFFPLPKVWHSDRFIRPVFLWALLLLEWADKSVNPTDIITLSAELEWGAWRLRRMRSEVWDKPNTSFIAYLFMEGVYQLSLLTWQNSFYLAFHRFLIRVSALPGYLTKIKNLPEFVSLLLFCGFVKGRMIGCVQ